MECVLCHAWVDSGAMHGITAGRIEQSKRTVLFCRQRIVKKIDVSNVHLGMEEQSNVVTECQMALHQNDSQIILKR